MRLSTSGTENLNSLIFELNSCIIELFQFSLTKVCLDYTFHAFAHSPVHIFHILDSVHEAVWLVGIFTYETKTEQNQKIFETDKDKAKPFAPKMALETEHETKTKPSQMHRY